MNYILDGQNLSTILTSYVYHWLPTEMSNLSYILPAFALKFDCLSHHSSLEIGFQTYNMHKKP